MATSTAAEAADTGAPVRGGPITMGIYAEPDFLTNAYSSAGPPLFVSTKVFDGLLNYDAQFKPQPGLATSWETRGDGLAITLHLRQGVKWHDGKPFTSSDVAWTLLNVWKTLHPQGRTTFANVTSVDTPDAHTVVLHVSEPSPYILNGLHAAVAQVLPKHLYEGRDVMTNPVNNAPVGTGPFRFKQWQRGSFVELERNPAYWQAGLPYLDTLYFRFYPDTAAASAALQTDAIQLGTNEIFPQIDLERLGKLPNLRLVSGDSPLTAMALNLDFNLDRPVFKDVRVRQAIYHAIDPNFIVKNIYFGFAKPAYAPLPDSLPQFFTNDVARYPYDLDTANALLDAAGFKRGAGGVRFDLTLDSNPKPAMMQVSQYLRAALSRVGIRVTLQPEDFGTYVKRIYTDRTFDLGLVLGNVGPDPVIGIQRFYASSSFKPGVPFSNGDHYMNPEVDRLLKAGATQTDPAKRRDTYVAFQQIVQKDLPRLPLVSLVLSVLYDKRLHNLNDIVTAYYGNFATVYRAAA
ncbi:ABC transporter substrate-binding protein [Robbsia sp. KACC 23696]|uniref:ABC transporter substrate-binding protein n=1 Tax=Robbsia sp. KACC 23696 TaxID=3149231 RepID=UPI00325B92C0